MKKKKKQKDLLRLPKGMCEALRIKGGPQTTRKGKKGYKRKKEKEVLRKWLTQDELAIVNFNVKSLTDLIICSIIYQAHLHRKFRCNRNIYG